LMTATHNGSVARRQRNLGLRLVDLSAVTARGHAMTCQTLHQSLLSSVRRDATVCHWCTALCRLFSVNKSLILPPQILSRTNARI
jgi:hypothetical protein